MKYLLVLFLLLSSVSFAQTEKQIVAAVIICEAGGEGANGMQAVANVIANRAAKGKTPLQVVTRKHQFECITKDLNNLQNFVNKASKHPKWQQALNMSEKIANKNLPDITGGSTHFHNTSMTPYWAKKIEFKVKIGGHLFYKE
jgi:N-acetylmuramoyl-L-alanine amidase